MLPQSGFETSILLIPFSIIGMLVNLIYIKISTKDERRAMTDNNIICICFASVLKCTEMLIRSCVVVTDQNVNSGILIGLDSVQFFADCIVLWSHCILSIFRFLFIREIELPQDHGNRQQQSNRCLKVVVTVVALTSAVYGVCIGVNDTICVPLMSLVFAAVVKLCPFLLMVFFHVTSMGRLIYIAYKRNVSVQPSYSFPQSLQSQEKIKRFIHVFSMQIICFIFPCFFVHSLEVVSFTKIDMNQITESYWIVRCLLVVLNPVTFGILLHPRIQYLVSILDITKVKRRNRRAGNTGLPTIREWNTGMVFLRQKSEIPLNSTKISSPYSSRVQSFSSGARSIIPSFVLTNADMEHEEISTIAPRSYFNKSLESLRSGTLSIASYDSETSVFTFSSMAPKIKGKHQMSPVFMNDNSLELLSPHKSKGVYLSKSISNHLITLDASNDQSAKTLKV